MESNELRQLVKESVWEVPREERLRLCQILIPYVAGISKSAPSHVESSATIAPKT